MRAHGHDEPCSSGEKAWRASSAAAASSSLCSLRSSSIRFDSAGAEIGRGGRAWSARRQSSSTSGCQRRPLSLPQAIACFTRSSRGLRFCEQKLDDGLEFPCSRLAMASEESGTSRREEHDGGRFSLRHLRRRWALAGANPLERRQLGHGGGGYSHGGSDGSPFSLLSLFSGRSRRWARRHVAPDRYAPQIWRSTSGAGR